MNKIINLVEHRSGEPDIPFNVILIEYGEEYGLNNSVTQKSYDPVVRFYDGRYADPEGKSVNFTELGQFTGGTYYLSTLLGNIEGRKDFSSGLILDMSISDWNISPLNLEKVVSEYEKYFDTLVIPEADFDEDYYSWNDLDKRFSVVNSQGEAFSLRSEVLGVLEAEIVNQSDKADHYGELFESEGVNQTELMELMGVINDYGWVNRIVDVPDYKINNNDFMKRAILNVDDNIALKRNIPMHAEEIIEKHGLQNVVEVVGDSEYGEEPYLISESLGNSSRDVIVYGYSPEEAIDNHVDHGEDEHGWEVSELEADELDTGNYIYAKGYFPVDLDYVSVKKVEEEGIDAFLHVQKKVDQLIKNKSHKNEMEM